jgi:hypothetical protein
MSQVTQAESPVCPGFLGEEGTECEICSEKLEDTEITILRCKHRFHRVCLEEWLHYDDGECRGGSCRPCPKCRRGTEKSSVTLQSADTKSAIERLKKKEDDLDKIVKESIEARDVCIMNAKKSEEAVKRCKEAAEEIRELATRFKKDLRAPWARDSSPDNDLKSDCKKSRKV